MWAEIQDQMAALWADTHIRSGVIVLASWLVAFLSEVVFRRTFVVLADRTANELDDKLVEAVERPLFWSVFSIGVSWAIALHDLAVQWILYGLIKTLLIILWTGAIMRGGEAMLASFAKRSKENSLLQVGTLPIFDIILKLVLISAGFYGVFLAWDIDVTAWLASAGIIGIAIGFAAQDTLANVIAGIVILADRPYRVGDFIVLEQDQTLRGKVTRIGLRSTRIQTLDNVEITVPNAEIGKSKIINEVGGPSVLQRIQAPVSVAYGSDVDQVVAVLQACPEGLADVCVSPPTEARFTGFGASGLDFTLLVWIREPAKRDVILSNLNKRIYEALNGADIEIPFDKRDVYIKEMPRVPTGADTGSQ